MIGSSRKSSPPNLTAMRRELDTLDATRHQIGDKLTEASNRYEQLERQRASVEGDLAARWQIEEQLDTTRAEIRDLAASKVAPDVRAGRLRAVLTPVLERESEAAHRSVDIQQCEKLLEAAALIARLGQLASDAREIGVSDGYAHRAFDPSIRSLEHLCSTWESTVAPQIRRSLADHRRVVAAVEDER